MYDENEFVDDEYINDDNDPQKVLIVPDDDYVISDNEEVIEYDEIIASPLIRPKVISDKVEYTRLLLVLKALRNGEFNK